MSLINQMLRDLDARHAPAMDRVALPGSVRVQSRPAVRPRPLLGLALGAAAVAATAAGFLAVRNDASPPALQVVPAQQHPVSPPLAAVAPGAPIPPLPLRGARPEPAKDDPRQLPAGPAKPKESPAGASAALRLDKNPLAARETKVLPPATVPPARNDALAVSPPPAAKDLVPEVQSSIDKRPRTPPGNEVAENEFRKAMAALRRGATAEAMDGLRAALRADARHASARQATLSLLVEQQQWREAQALLEEGLALDPAQTGWAMILARLQFEAGKLGDAAETLARHAAHAENDADFQAFDALLMQKMKRFGEAIARYRKALALKPTEARWWYGLGLALDADQKPQEARAAMLRARETGDLPQELAAAVDQRLR